MSYPGGLAERMTVPSYMALPVPREVPAEWVALAEPLSGAVRAARRGRFVAGEDVVVLGAGTLGLAVLQVVRVLGARSVTVVEGIPFRRQIASELGADQVILAEGELSERLREFHSGGPDIIFDCTGSNLTPATAIQSVRLGGRVVQVGIPTSPAMFDFLPIVLREVELIGTLGHIYDEDYRVAIDLIASEQVNVAKLITHRLSLDDAVPKGLAALAANTVENVLKIVIMPNRA
jgi:(R,R)-butanediol dehydrogenase/meso-butanediol dehydrogenase/diacetyl reductase